jgi:hypothetical protein
MSHARNADLVPKTQQQKIMIDDIEGSAKVQQDEENKISTVSAAEQVVHEPKQCSLTTVTGPVRRLKLVQQSMGVEVTQQLLRYNPL